ncbi:extensin-2-like [Cimex lectularius]|uniref:CPR type cuticle protein n=1 Tax=Cimex lectularius TaxID=79782 RepID=A0A8I6TJ20_CIMLE|nr:extensin-2-like [Cimex lectularius]
MELLPLTVFAVLSTAVLCEELATEVKREKKDISKLQNLGLNYGNKFNKGYYPSGGYLPPSYNYDYNYDRRPFYPTPQCDCRVSPPPPPPARCGPSFYPGPSGFGQQTFSSASKNYYLPPRPAPFPPSATVDDTLVVYPAGPPSVTVNAVAPVLSAHSPKAVESSGYNYARPTVPFN